jgi:hypothetical protein
MIAVSLLGEQTKKQQLALALGEWLTIEGQDVHAIPAASTRDRRPRCARPVRDGRYRGSEAARVRPLPSRDGRGRFVVYPTSDAPSWYVFCCDGYRIKGDAIEQRISLAP